MIVILILIRTRATHGSRQLAKILLWFKTSEYGWFQSIYVKTLSYLYAPILLIRLKLYVCLELPWVPLPRTSISLAPSTHLWSVCTYCLVNSNSAIKCVKVETMTLIIDPRMVIRWCYWELSDLFVTLPKWWQTLTLTRAQEDKQKTHKNILIAMQWKIFLVYLLDTNFREKFSLNRVCISKLAER